jgi:hypothetical protein
LSAGSDHFWSILSKFEWEIIEDSKLNNTPVPNFFGFLNRPQLLGEVKLQITLSKRPPSIVMGMPPFMTTITNEGSLSDEAFQPKSFTVRIERGNFKCPSEIGKPEITSPKEHLDMFNIHPRSDLRILFDPSPYPPKNEWWRPRSAICPPYTEFIGQSVPRLEDKGRAMNDDPFFGCIVL